MMNLSLPGTGEFGPHSSPLTPRKVGIRHYDSLTLLTGSEGSKR